ncbi:MAG: polymer-forming cytoskeletal protein [Eubacteriales bacterium]
MDNTIKGDLKIDGSGSAPGGEYNSVKINGAGRITGDVVCREFRINGSGNVDGNIDMQDGKINGTGTIDGNIKAKLLKITGSGQVRGSISGDNIYVSGSVTIGENLDVQKIKIEGSAKVGHDCNAENFHSDGTFEISGLLNADDITIKLYHSKSRAKEIGGGRISVSVGSDAGFNVLKTIFTLGMYNPVLEADSIEGDEIVLENTTAKVVRGTNVTVGKGCNIGLVEYKGYLLKTGDAKVGEEKKI